MRRRRAPEIIAGRVNGDGSIAAGDGFTVLRTAAGNYTITLVGLRLIAAVAFVLTGPTAATGNGGGVTTQGEKSFTVAIFASTTGVVGDGPFSFIAAGVQT